MRPLLLTVVFYLVSCTGGGGDDGISGTGFVSGSAQKGPFGRGSEVSVNVNEGINWIPVREAKTEDDLGQFSFSYEKNKLIEIIIRGFHYNELTGSLSSGKLTLKSIFFTSADDEQQAYVNLLTHLIHGRLTYLLAEAGLEYKQAVQQAQDELTAALDPVVLWPSSTDFNQLGVYNFPGTDQDGNAYLLALSAILYRTATAYAEQGDDTSVDAQLSATISKLADDLKDNGIIDRFDNIIDDMLEAKALVDVNAVILNMIQLKDEIDPELTVPDIKPFFEDDPDGRDPSGDNDYDQDGLANLEDPHPFQFELIVQPAEASTVMGTPVTINLEYNQPPDHSLMFKTVAAVEHGVIEAPLPELVFTPHDGFFGSLTVDFVLSTGEINSRPVTLTIDVVPPENAELSAYVQPPHAVTGQDFAYQPAIHNPNNLELRYALASGPAWLSIDPVTARLTGTPGPNDAADWNDVQLLISGGDNIILTALFSLQVLPNPWTALDPLPFGATPGSTAMMYERVYDEDIITVFHSLQTDTFQTTNRIWKFNRTRQQWESQIYSQYLPPAAVTVCHPLMVVNDPLQNRDRVFFLHGAFLFWEFFQEDTDESLTHCIGRENHLFRFGHGKSKHYDYSNEQYTVHDNPEFGGLVDVVDAGGTVYLFNWKSLTDKDSQTGTLQLMRYNTASHTAFIASIAPVVHRDFAAVYREGKIFLLAGSDPHPVYYDIKNTTWYRSTIAMPFNLSNPAVINDAETIRLLGGYGAQTPQTFFIQYRPDWDSFREIP